MFLGAQYYRPPFPSSPRWKDDLDRMRDSGLRVVQLWAMWGWIESTPGTYRFDDYDELLGLAAERDLQVVLSTIAEIQPHWIHRAEPGTHLVEASGRIVESGLRNESNVGITPGGCWDHDPIRDRIGGFLTAVTAHFRGVDGILAFDAWNENRWTNGADGPTCYCPATLAHYRRWLEERYGSLDGLNEAWHRRYVDWEDVVPSRGVALPFTDGVEFQRFLAHRAARHTRYRYDTIKAADPDRFVTAHGGWPSPIDFGLHAEQPLCRGSDWDHADELDGYGCSHFPLNDPRYSFDEATMGARLECARGAVGDKVLWVSELQGGRASMGLNGNPPVTADVQQRWVWSGYGRGAKGIIFWCWRDEVFGVESSGFGLAGNDGRADERLAAMADSGRVLEEHDALLEAYVPDAGKVGVLFDPTGLFIDHAATASAEWAADTFRGYLAALERVGVPYTVCESRHLDVLPALRVLFIPHGLAVPPAAADAIVDWVGAGGTVVVEAECDAFTENGFYLYPDERSFVNRLGIVDLGRRPPETLDVEVDGGRLVLSGDRWTTPYRVDDDVTEVLARTDEGPVVVSRAVGRGRVVAVGTTLGAVYAREPYRDFERFVAAVVRRGGGLPDLVVESETPGLVWRTGRSGDATLAFVINPGPELRVTVRGPADRFSVDEALELRTGASVRVRHHGLEAELQATIPAGGAAVYRL